MGGGGIWIAYSDVVKLMLVEFPASRLAVLQCCWSHHVDLSPSSALLITVSFTGRNTKTESILDGCCNCSRCEQMKAHPHVHESQTIRASHCPLVRQPQSVILVGVS